MHGATTHNDIRKGSLLNLTTTMKLAISFIAAHLTAVSTIGIVYMLGIFDVGFLSEESLALKIWDHVVTIIA